MERSSIYPNSDKNQNLFQFLLNNKLYFAAVLFAFFIPLLIGHLKDLPTQLFVGTAVNFLIAFCALKFSAKKSIPVLLLPAIAAYFSGFIFGSASMFLLYLIPFIWAGNAVYFLAIKQMRGLKSIPIASAAKAALIFFATFSLVSLSIVPALFLFPMGILQLITALAGGAFALSSVKKAV